MYAWSYFNFEAVKLKVPYTTTISAAEAAVEGIEHLVNNDIEVRPLPSMNVEISL